MARACLWGPILPHKDCAQMKNLFVCFLLCAILAESAKADSCKTFLAQVLEESTVASNTQNFISYLNVLFSDGVIKLDYINNLLTQIEAGKSLQNPFGTLYTKSEQTVHQPTFQYYLEQGHLDKSKLKQWANDFLKDQMTKQDRLKGNKENTTYAGTQMKFERINPGKLAFERLDSHGRNYISFELTHPFEMMNIPVTEFMWVEKMGVNPAYQKNSPYTIEMKIHSKKILLRPDNPIQNISWWSAAIFANKISLAAGLEPVYDFNDIKHWSGSAEEGSLFPVNETDDRLVKINAPNGDIYKAKGYRLPTIYEQLFVLSDRGRSPTPYFKDLQHSDLKNYANDTIGGVQTHPLKEKLPFIIDGKEFFDFYTIWEWSHDSAIDSSYTPILQSGIDPVGSIIALPIDHLKNMKNADDDNGRGPSIPTEEIIPHRLFHMGSALTDFRVITPNAAAPYLGLRLVRSLPK